MNVSTPDLAAAFHEAVRRRDEAEADRLYDAWWESVRSRSVTLLEGLEAARSKAEVPKRGAARHAYADALVVWRDARRLVEESRELKDALRKRLTEKDGAV